MQLYFEHYPDPESKDYQAHDGSISEPVVILPGLFGSTTNWRGFARALSQHSDVYVLDNRNHGRSPHAGSHTYQDMAEDLLAFLDAQSINQAVVVGHSMGGKVAMVFSLLNPARVSSLCVLDIAPVHYAHSHTSLLQALQAIDLDSLKSRSEADRILQESIADTGLRLFLLQSLTGRAGEYRWRINISVLQDYMDDIVGFPEQLVSGKQFSAPVQLVYGMDSDYALPTHQTSFDAYFTNLEHKGVENAGHWLHADQPQQVYETIRDFLQKNA